MRAVFREGMEVASSSDSGEIRWEIAGATLSELLVSTLLLGVLQNAYSLCSTGNCNK